MTGAFVHRPGGEGPGVGLVLVHGAGMDHTAWRYLARFLAHHGRRVLAPDLPGHGRSPGPAPKSVEDLTAWLLGLIGEEGPVTLIGHSLGGMVALAAAAQAPTLVEGLILISTAAELRVHPQLQAAARAHQQKAVDLILSWSFGPGGRFGGRTDPGTSALGVARRILQRELRTTLAGDLEAADAYRGGPADAAQIRAPTLVLCGSEDRVVAADSSAALARAIPGSRLELVEDGGHMLMMQRPEQVRRAVASFLRPR